jgi:hypothetical protein
MRLSLAVTGALWSGQANAQDVYPPPIYPPPIYARPLIVRGAEIRLLATPRDAEVYVDGYYSGVVHDFSGLLQRLRLPPGDHGITLHLRGYRTVTQKITLAPGSTYRIRYAMEKLAAGTESEAPPGPSPQAPQSPLPRPLPPLRGPMQRAAPGPRSDFGTLAIRVQPAGAEILIDGERWSGSENNDRLLVQVADGLHHVEIVKEGYRRFSADVQVHGGQTLPLNVSLTPSLDKVF